jgi:hypothetical protein
MMRANSFPEICFTPLIPESGRSRQTPWLSSSTESQSSMASLQAGLNFGKRLPLRGAARQRRNFRPKSAFLGQMNNSS